MDIQIELKIEPAQAYSVLYTTFAYDADTAVHMQSDCQPRTSALPADVGLPKSCTATPDPNPVDAGLRSQTREPGTVRTAAL